MTNSQNTSTNYSIFEILRNLHKLRYKESKCNDCYRLVNYTNEFSRFVLHGYISCTIYYLHPERDSDDKNSFTIFDLHQNRIDIKDNIDVIFNIERYSDTELLMIFGKKFTDENLYGEDSYIIINYLEGL